MSESRLQTPSRSTNPLDGHDMVVTTFHLLSDGLVGSAASMRSTATETAPQPAFISRAAISSLGEACGRFGIRRVSLIGHAVRPGFDADREVVELLVEPGVGERSTSLHPDRDIDRWIDLSREFESALGLPVELVAPEDLGDEDSWPRSSARSRKRPGDAASTPMIELWRAETVESCG